MRQSIYLGISALVFVLPLLAKQESPPPPPPFDADLFKKDAQVVSAHGEFLFWRVQEGCLDYALRMEEPAWGPSNCYANGNFENATFNGEPGFRLGLSYFRAPHYWEVKGQYTRLTSEGDDVAGKPSATTDYLTGTWPQIFPGAVAKAKSHIHMNYNLLDIWVDRVFIPNNHLRIRLLGGIMVTWINQDWKITYNDSSANSTVINNYWRFIGGGLRGGTILDWYWGSNVYITGGTTFGTLVGNYKNQAKQTTNFPIDATYNASLPARNSYFSDVRPSFTAQLFFGPSYQRDFTNNRIEVFVGYETNVWMNLQEIYRSTSGSPQAAKETWINSSMMALQGLTSRVTLDF